MRGEMNSNRLEISFRWKILLQCSVCSLLVSTWNEGKWNESGMDFILVILTEMKFQAGMRFSSEKKLPKTKWISADSLDIVLNAHVRLNILASVISSYSFWQSEKYYVNTTRNEMRTHAHQNIGSFWYEPKQWNVMCTEHVFTPVSNIKPVWVHLPLMWVYSV